MSTLTCTHNRRNILGPGRRGLSILEVVGTVAALGIGLAIGSAYMGIDLKQAAEVGMQKVGLKEAPPTPHSDGSTGEDASLEELIAPYGQEGILDSSTPSSANSEDSTAPNGQGPSQAESGDEGESNAESTGSTDSSDVPESDDKTSENAFSATIDAIRRHKQQGTPRPANPAVQSNDAQPVARRTLAYWNKLNEIMLKEEQLRTVPSGGLNKGNAGGFLSGRGKASRFAAQAMTKLPTLGVDPAVVRHARRIAKWYEKQGALNDQAEYLLHEADVATRQGPAGKAWQSAEKQHQQQLALVNRSSVELRMQMTSKYGIAFPPLR